MRPLPERQYSRRLLLMIFLVIIGFAAGFVWGRWFGYAQGRSDTIRAIEQKVAEAKPNTIPI